MFERAGLAAAAMPMARMSAGGLQAARPSAGRVAGPRGPLNKLDARLGNLPGRIGGPGRSGRRRSGFAPQPLGGTDLAPYRRRAAQLATLLESDRPLPRLVRPAGPAGMSGPEVAGVPGGNLGWRLGLVRVGVEALVADLDSVDAVEEEVRPLRDLVGELRALAGSRVPGREGLERLRERALAVLRAFAAPSHRQPLERRQEFWRR
jgi:hypothetical protein